MNSPQFASAMRAVEAYLGCAPAGPLAERCRLNNLLRLLQIQCKGQLKDFCRDLGVFVPARKTEEVAQHAVNMDALANWLYAWRKGWQAGNVCKPARLANKPPGPVKSSAA